MDYHIRYFAQYIFELNRLYDHDAMSVSYEFSIYNICKRITVVANSNKRMAITFLCGIGMIKECV